MQELIGLFDIHMTYIVLALLISQFLLFILIIIMFTKYSKLKKKYNHFMHGDQLNIEELLTQCINQTDVVQKEHKSIMEHILQTKDQIKHCIQKVGIVRYQAIQGEGSDLSFAIALLDQADNGVVINGIYTRAGSYTYGKPIINSSSQHTLSDEELEAIKKAQQHTI